VSRTSLLVCLASLVACDGREPGEKDGGTDVPEYADLDGDGIIDQHDGTEDADADGSPNEDDLDSDGDGVGDRIEAGDADPMTYPIDTDGDGASDFLDVDSDDNCINDAEEQPAGVEEILDTDGDGEPDFRDGDNDGDNIRDATEIGSSCGRPDTDEDALPDYLDVDSDDDGIDDVYESGILAGLEGRPIDTDEDGTPDYLDEDSDGDGLYDSEEGGTSSGSPPNDTDGDGTYDFQDLDADGDGLPDLYEVEIQTDPFDADTDGDGYTDGAEIEAGTNPRDPDDVIDGLYVVVPERADVESTFGFELRIQEGDIAFLIDTTCSMTATAQAVANEFSELVNQLTDVLPAAKFGVGTFDDYAMLPFGDPSSNDKPFIMQQQITEDLEAAQDALSSMTIHYGGDGPESAMEAMYQAATGAGYDQDCDEEYDNSTDVKPFIATTDDPFGGGWGQFYDSSDDSTGQLGGFGFNDYALPIVVMATDNELRDPEDGYGSPGGCPQDAGFSDVVSAVGDLGAYLIQVSTNSQLGIPQMEELATATGSTADTDGNGIANDLLVYEWTGSDDDFRESVVGAISDLLNSITFDKVSLKVDGDEWGFVQSIDPPYYDGFEPEDNGEIVQFTLSFIGMVAATTNDQLFELELVVLGDDEVALDKMDIIVVVPGTSY
jgi:hypothetical protein